MKPSDDPKKLTSLEAAALYLSGGATTDPEKAVHYDQGQELQMDALQRAHLRRMMGFNFELKIRDKKLVVSSAQPPYVSTWCGYPGEMDEKTVDKLVEACLRLKTKYARELRKQEV
jgi:hypothetical protein